jgi:hypothetical protein
MESPSSYSLSTVFVKDRVQSTVRLTDAFTEGVEISKRKANWIGYILRRNCLLKQVVEGKIKGGIEMTGRRGRRRRELLDGLKERRGYSRLKEEALDRTMWRVRIGRGLGPVMSQTAK